MTFWYMLVVSYSLEFNGEETYQFEIPFKDYHTCIAAQDQIHAAIYKNYRAIQSSCIETDRASSTIRPKARPDFKKEK